MIIVFEWWWWWWIHFFRVFYHVPYQRKTEKHHSEMYLAGINIGIMMVTPTFDFDFSFGSLVVSFQNRMWKTWCLCLCV